jgi:hypothetical protein
MPATKAPQMAEAISHSGALSSLSFSVIPRLYRYRVTDLANQPIIAVSLQQGNRVEATASIESNLEAVKIC